MPSVMAVSGTQKAAKGSPPRHCSGYLLAATVGVVLVAAILVALGAHYARFRQNRFETVEHSPYL
jgi:hypothetical protein